jgi:zinc transporter ZupT
MATPPSGSRSSDTYQRDAGIIGVQQDPIAGRALGFLVLLNGAAALLMLSAFAFGLQSTEPKLVAAMLVFGSGAMTGLLSTFLTYLNRVVRAEAPERVQLRDAMRAAAMVAVIASGASFLIGLNMVGTATTSRSSTHPKTKLQDRGLAAAPAPTEKTDPAVRLQSEAPGRSLPGDRFGLLRVSRS